MAFQEILDEVNQLHSVSARLEVLADDNLPMSEALLSVAGNVRGSATVLAVLVAAELQTGDGHRSLD